MGKKASKRRYVDHVYAGVRIRRLRADLGAPPQFDRVVSREVRLRRGRLQEFVHTLQEFLDSHDEVKVVEVFSIKFNSREKGVYIILSGILPGASEKRISKALAAEEEGAAFRQAKAVAVAARRAAKREKKARKRSLQGKGASQ